MHQFSTKKKATDYPISSNYQSKKEDDIVIIDPTSKKRYLRLKFLGKGGFARCYEVKNENDKILACKIVSKSLLVKPHQKAKMASEISIHRSLTHQNVVQFNSYFEDKDNVYVLLEICRNRSLMELHKRRRCLTDPEVRFYFRQIIEGCAYLHDTNVIHRDLKLGNLFLDDDLRVKIGDFGLATKIEFPGERKRTLCGTPNYIAPEVLNKRGHSFEVDVWSAGCILYTLLVGTPPFETTTLAETYNRIKKNDYTIPSRVPRLAQNLIVKMLQKEPTARPTMHAILLDSYFTEQTIPHSLPLSSLTVAPRYDEPLNKPMPRPLGNFTGVTTNSNAAASQRNAIIQQQNLASNRLGSHVHTVQNFANNQMIQLRWFPALPVAKTPTTPTNPNRDAHAVRVQDGTLTTIDDFDSEDDLNEPRDCYLNELMSSLLRLVNMKPDKYPQIQLDEAEDPKYTPLYWVSKWVDYSEKYGLGYELSDNSIGVFFNDVTQIISLHGKTDIGTYIDIDGTETCLKMALAPSEMSKKVTIFQNFYHYMEANLISTGADVSIERNAEVARLPYLRLWVRNDDVIIFQLTCGILQANFFKDHTKLIICPRMKAVTYIDEVRTFKTYPINSLEKYGCSSAIISRIRYILIVLKKVVSATTSATAK